MTPDHLITLYREELAEKDTTIAKQQGVIKVLEGTITQLMEKNAAVMLELRYLTSETQNSGWEPSESFREAFPELFNG